MMLKIDLASAKYILASNPEVPDIGQGLAHSMETAISVDESF